MSFNITDGDFVCVHAEERLLAKHSCLKILCTVKKY
jgi:hypothetical protein